MKLPNLKQLNRKTKILTITGLCLIFTLTAFTITQAKQTKKQKEEQYLTPLTEQKQETPRYKQTASEEKIYSLDYYLHLAKSFLGKATRLANDNPTQNETDKAKIINTINEALNAANQAIKHYPKSAEGYLLRAQIYQKVEHIWPEVKEKREKDLKTANQILNKPDPNLPQEDQAQPLDFIPMQQANKQSNIIIAEPNQEQKQQDTQTKTDINANKGEAVIKAGQTEIRIQTSKLKQTSLIYTKPTTKTENQTLYIKARNNQEGWFIIAIQKDIKEDITFTWWLIDQE